MIHAVLSALESLPLIGGLIAQIAMPFNVFIAYQDQRVIVTHQSQSSSMEIGERLIQGDLPKLAYRRRRAELKKSKERSTLQPQHHTGSMVLL